MSVLINIERDTDRIFVTRLDKNNIKSKILKQFSSYEYLIDHDDHNDYIKAKEIQIQMDREGYRNVPCV